MILGSLKAFLLAFALVFSAGAAAAQSAPPNNNSGLVTLEPTTPLVPNAMALEYLRSKGNVLQYIGSSHGLDAYMAEAPNGSIQTFYVSPDGQGVLAGLMFDINGRNITMSQVMNLLQTNPDALASVKRLQESNQSKAKSNENLSPEEMFAKAQVVIGAVDKANWFRMGKETAPVVYVIIDPNCPWCERAIKYLEPYLANGGLQLRVIVVGMLSETSLPKAAAIVSSENPVATLMEYEGRAKAPPPVETISQDDILLVRQNEQFVRDYGLEGTPFFILRDYQGIPRMIRGMPKNMPDDLMNMLRPPPPK